MPGRRSPPYLDSRPSTQPPFPNNMSSAEASISGAAPNLNQAGTPELDAQKLQSLPQEQRELFLLTFVSGLTKHVAGLSKDDCSAQQVYLKKEILSILNLQNPQPSRVVRNNLGKCLAYIFGVGDRKLLFETINDLVAILAVGKTKSDAETRTKHAAVTCLGYVFATAGDSAIGLHQLACTSLMKLLKSAQNNAGLRASALAALAKIADMVQGSMDENIARDAWKQARSHAASDKGHLVVVSACKCLKSLVQHTPYFRNSADFDKLETAACKAIDSASPQVRRAAADCLAEALAQGYCETGAPPPVMALPKARKPRVKRGATGGLEDEDEAPSRSQSPAPGGRKSQTLAMTCREVLKVLSSQYVRSSMSNRGRAGLGVCYGLLLRRLGESVVESNYLAIVENLALDVVGHANVANNRYRLLISRRVVDIVLGDIVNHKILGEANQKSVASSLISKILKDFPQTLPERPEPSKHTLVMTLGALSSLIDGLGSAANVFAEPCRDALLQVLQHPGYTVQAHASACLKAFVLACPQQLLPCLNACMNSLTRELSHLIPGRNSPRKCIGLAHGLAAALSVSPLRPLYGSVDVNSRVLTMATNLLKSSGQSELRVSSTQIQVAWILIGGLMSLGPNFVKIHLSQLLLLWKNALPKPLAKDNTAARGLLEASFLAHVRECALGSILAFLQSNQRLLTVDVCKRIATMLQNTTAFLKTLPGKKTTDDISQRLTPALQLQDIETMVQRRVLQCYIKLVKTSPAGGSEALLQSNLLPLVVSLFADPENYAANSLSSSIATAAGSFETLWDVGDNSGFGVTGLVRGFNVGSLPGQFEKSVDHPVLEDGSTEEAIDKLLLSPVCGTLEHDASLLYMGGAGRSELLPDPPATEAINLAIQLFAFVFPLTPAKVQESILEQIKTFSSAGVLQRDPGRKAAINVNIAATLVSTLRVAAKETNSPAGDITALPVERLLQDMLRDMVIDADPYVRSIGYAAVARLCNACGNAFTNQEIKYLIDTIVMNREPSARAGCAMALGAIQSKVGGMASGYHLKAVSGYLVSLCSDPHPTVHFWALEALALVSDAAGLGFAPSVPGALAMLAQLYGSDTHHAEQASTISMNLEMETSTAVAIARCVDSLVNVLGPDLQDSTKPRELMLTLVTQLQEEEDILVQQASLACLEHLSLYAPGHMVFADYVKLLQRYLNCDDVLLRDAAVDGLFNIMRRDPKDVISSASKGFEEQLWLVLDTDPSHDGIRNMIRNWMRQTCLKETSRWLQRFQSVFKMTRARTREETSTRTKNTAAVPDLQDEEVAGFAGGAKEDKEAAAADVEPLRWQVTTFAMSCINDMFMLVAKDVATNGESAGQVALQGKIADVIRLAFTASTSGVLELRIWGLKTIGAVLKMFGKTADPDFEEAMLLEQYQAQISSALTPAFAADSSPELASEAVSVCAGFVATGIVTDVDRMGRILKTLVAALDNFSKETEHAGIGDLKGLSSNAQVMVKMSVFSAWAELQVASLEQQYLVEVLRPHIGTLTPLWLESLREFARLRFEPDISMTLGPPSLSGSLDTIYSALNRETLLRFYQDSWLKLVDAIASLIEQDSDFVFDALDGKELQGPATNGQPRSADINYRDEPVAFFFVLFGIAFEALATKPSQNESLELQEQTLSILHALRKILHPSVSGHAIYRDAIFSETMDLLDRLVLTDGLDVQGVIVEIARALCVSHPSARKKGEKDESDGSDLSDDIEQLFELTRIIVLVLSGLLPNLAESSQPLRHQMTEEAIVLVATALDALVDAAAVFPAVIKTDLHACIIHIFATILATPSAQGVIVPQSLPTLKRFVAGMTGSRKPLGNTASPTDVQLQGCLRRFLAVYLKAQRREEPASLACVRNCLLASTILFTGGKNHLPASDPLVSRYLEELLDCLTDRMVSDKEVIEISMGLVC
jgi:HEAT repeat-containing protein 5